MQRANVRFLLALTLFTVVVRLIPYGLYAAGVDINPESTWYPWNFMPLMAVTVFCGACSRPQSLSTLWAPGVLLATDLGIWALTGRADWAFGMQRAPVYLCLFAIGAASFLWVSQRPGWTRAYPTVFLGEVFFFLVTNFAVWAGAEHVRYPQTAAGLAACYVAALPFFGRSLASSAIFTGLLFSPLGLRQAGVVPVAERRTVAAS
jgi:hypothetical protein